MFLEAWNDRDPCLRARLLSSGKPPTPSPLLASDGGSEIAVVLGASEKSNTLSSLGDRISEILDELLPLI